MLHLNNSGKIIICRAGNANGEIGERCKSRINKGVMEVRARSGSRYLPRYNVSDVRHMAGIALKFNRSRRGE